MMMTVSLTREACSDEIVCEEVEGRKKGHAAVKRSEDVGRVSNGRPKPWFLEYLVWGK